jgi:2',3'-cyclic-nucleotide 2'-phosphodiesterase (5'-nucleotidase family)
VRRLFTLALGAALAFAAAQSTSERVALTLLSTTDLHGNIYPIDYATNLADERGLVKIATLIRQVRKESPHVMLLNTGDTLPGTALAFYHATHSSQPPPIITAMNALGFDAMVLGNHEYDFGWPAMLTAVRASRFPWLAANAAPPAGQKPFYQPYLIKEIAGVRVAVLGLTTTAIPNWDDPDAQRRRITLEDPLAAARHWVPVLHDREHADVVVAALHMGLEEDPETGKRAPGQTEGENQALAIARQVPGIDVILMGHTHRQVPTLTVNGVLLTQPAAWGRSLARVDLKLEAVAGRWHVVSKEARTIPVAGVEPDAEVLRIGAPVHMATGRWLDEPIGNSARDYRAGPERFQPTALLDFVHRVQLEAGNADVSLAESLAPTAHVPAGTVTVRHLFGLYGVEKKLVALEITGAQLRVILEQSARYFRHPEPGKPPDAWVDPDFPSYNYYMASGVTYDLDAARPPGKRIVNLRFRGQLLSDNQRLRLVTNNYLANGTAEYAMLRGAKVLWRSQLDLRELLIVWFRNHGTLPDAPAANWRLLPAGR